MGSYYFWATCQVNVVKLVRWKGHRRNGLLYHSAVINGTENHFVSWLYKLLMQIKWGLTKISGWVLFHPRTLWSIHDIFNRGMEKVLCTNTYLTCSTYAVRFACPEPCQRPSAKQLAFSQKQSTNQKTTSCVTLRLRSHDNGAAVMWLVVAGIGPELSCHPARTNFSVAGNRLGCQPLQGAFQTQRHRS